MPHPGAGIHALLACLAVVLSSAAQAAEGESGGLISSPFTPFQISMASGATQLLERATPVYGQPSEVVGVDVGTFNEAESTIGLGVGIVNGSRSVSELQIGLLDFIEKGSHRPSPPSTSAPETASQSRETGWNDLEAVLSGCDPADPGLESRRLHRLEDPECIFEAMPI
jgi:hypothetical protein